METAARSLCRSGCGFVAPGNTARKVGFAGELLTDES